MVSDCSDFINEKVEIIIKQYICYETSVITESPYAETEYGFCITENYDYTYQNELPRFKKIDFRAYALPYGDEPIKKYLGIGNLPCKKEDAPEWCFEMDGLVQSENEIITLRSCIHRENML